VLYRIVDVLPWFGFVSLLLMLWLCVHGTGTPIRRRVDSSLVMAVSAGVVSFLSRWFCASFCVFVLWDTFWDAFPVTVKRLGWSNQLFRLSGMYRHSYILLISLTRVQPSLDSSLLDVCSVSKSLAVGRPGVVPHVWFPACSPTCGAAHDARTAAMEGRVHVGVPPPSYVRLDEAVARGDDVQSVRSNGKSVFLFCNLSSCGALEGTSFQVPLNPMVCVTLETAMTNRRTFLLF